MRRAALALAALLLAAGPAAAQRPPAGGLANEGAAVRPQALPGAPSSSPAPPAAGRPLGSARLLPLALAQAAAAAAVETCARQGYRVSAAVVDAAGQVRALLRGDGAGPHTLDSSTRKAYTAASLRASTARYADIAAGTPGAAGLRDIPGLLLLGGGLPILAGEEVVGGIGVGGAPAGDLDEACARAGAGAIAERLR